MSTKMTVLVSVAGLLFALALAAQPARGAYNTGFEPGEGYVGAPDSAGPNLPDPPGPGPSQLIPQDGWFMNPWWEGNFFDVHTYEGAEVPFHPQSAGEHTLYIPPVNPFGGEQFVALGCSDFMVENNDPPPDYRHTNKGAVNHHLADVPATLVEMSVQYCNAYERDFGNYQGTFTLYEIDPEPVGSRVGIVATDGSQGGGRTAPWAPSVNAYDLDGTRLRQDNYGPYYRFDGVEGFDNLPRETWWRMGLVVDLDPASDDYLRILQVKSMNQKTGEVWTIDDPKAFVGTEDETFMYALPGADDVGIYNVGWGTLSMFDNIYVDDPYDWILQWQGAAGNWHTANWRGGQAPYATGQDPYATVRMVIDADTDDSVVTVDADVTAASGTGPVAAVAISENNHLAQLIVPTGKTLEVAGNVSVYDNGTLQVEGTITANDVLVEGQLNVAASGTVAAAGTVDVGGTANLDIGGALSADGLQVADTSTVDIDGTLTLGSEIIKTGGTVNLNATGTLAALTARTSPFDTIAVGATLDVDDLTVDSALDSDGVGALTATGGLTMAAGSEYVWQRTGGVNDVVNVGGDLVLEDGWKLTIPTGDAPVEGEPYDLFTYDIINGGGGSGFITLDPADFDDQGGNWNNAFILYAPTGASGRVFIINAGEYLWDAGVVGNYGDAGPGHWNGGNPPPANGWGLMTVDDGAVTVETAYTGTDAALRLTVGGTAGTPGNYGSVDVANDLEVILDLTVSGYGQVTVNGAANLKAAELEISGHGQVTVNDGSVDLLGPLTISDNGALSIAALTTVSVDTDSDSTIPNNVTGTGTLAFAGTGSVALEGVSIGPQLNTGAGNQIDVTGDVTLAGGGNIASAVVIDASAASASLTFPSGNANLAATAVIGATGGNAIDLVVDGATVVMDAGAQIANNVPVTLSGGSLTINDSSALEAGGSLTFNGGTLISTGTTLDVTTHITAAGATVNVAADKTLTLINNPASWLGELIKTGDGTLAFDGGLTISGTVEVLKVLAGDIDPATAISTSDGAMVSVAVSDALGGGGTLTLYDNSVLQATANATINRTIALDAGGGTFDTDGGTVLTLNSLLGSTAITKIGDGTLDISGAGMLANEINACVGTVVTGDYQLALPGANPINICDGAVVEASGAVSRTVNATGGGSGMLYATGNTIVGTHAGGFDFGGTLKAAAGVRIDVIDPDFSVANPGASPRWSSVDGANIRSISIGPGGTVTSGGEIVLPDGSASYGEGTTGVLWVDGDTTVGGVVFGGTQDGEMANVYGANFNPLIDKVVFTGIRRGNWGSFLVDVSVTGKDDLGFSPVFSPNTNFTFGDVSMVLEGTQQYTPVEDLFPIPTENDGQYTQYLIYGTSLDPSGSGVGTFTADSMITVTLGEGYLPTEGDEFFLVRTDGALWGRADSPMGEMDYLDGTLLGIDLIAPANVTVPAGMQWEATEDYFRVWVAEGQVIPEPGTLLILLSGFVALLLARRCRAR